MEIRSDALHTADYQVIADHEHIPSDCVVPAPLATITKVTENHFFIYLDITVPESVESVSTRHTSQCFGIISMTKYQKTDFVI